MRTLVLALLLFAVAGCATRTVKPASPVRAPKTVTETEKGSIITVKRGETVKLRLASNPTTGYDWKFFIDPEGVVVEADNRFIAPTGKLVGAGGFREYTVRAVAPGFAVVVGYYHRPWERLDTEKARSVNYTIQVKE